jgi:long-chain acyl-CoA synthetase
MPEQARWSDVVTPSVINGHPALAYAQRPRRITSVLTEARRWSDRTLLIQGERQVSFTEHEIMVRRIADRLFAEGVRRSHRVAIFAANSPEWVATFFAVLSLGAVVVPCNGWWSAEEVAHACSAVEPTVLICDERRLERSPSGTRIIMTAALLEGSDSSVSADLLDLEDADEDEPAIILFTAGTTGFPKGALLSHRALVANLQTLLVVSGKLPHQIADDNPASVALVGLPLFHIGAIQLILVPLMTGSQVVFLEGRFDAGVVLEQLESRRVTMFSGVPTMMERLLAHPEAPRRDLSSLRTVVLGGSPVEDGLLERIRGTFPGTTRGVGQTYGLTEAGGVVSTGVGAQIREHWGSSGRLAPVVEVRIDEPDDDGNGRILVRSPAAMDGYWGLPEDTTIDADGWLDTGDLGHVDDDRYLYITGRAKELIIRGGENIAPARVEAVLSAHPSVAEVAVVGLSDADLGEVVGAAVVLRAADDATVAELEAFASERLAQFSVPERWWIRSEQLPVNDAGKVLKTKLIADWPQPRQAICAARVPTATAIPIEKVQADDAVR